MRKRNSNSAGERHSSFVAALEQIMDLTIDGNRNGQGFSDSSPSDDVYGRYGFYSQLSDYLWLKGVRVTENYGYGL